MANLNFTGLDLSHLPEHEVRRGREFANLIYALLQRTRTTKAQFRAKTGVTKPTLLVILNDGYDAKTDRIRQPRLITVKKIASAFGLDEEELKIVAGLPTCLPSDVMIRPPVEQGMERLSFAQWLEAIRNSKGFTRPSFAREVGVPASLIRAYETGRCRPREDNARKIARVLKRSEDEILRRAGLSIRRIGGHSVADDEAAKVLEVYSKIPPGGFRQVALQMMAMLQESSQEKPVGTIRTMEAGLK